MVQLPLEMEEARLAVMVWLDRDLPMSKGALRWDFPIALSACRGRQVLRPLGPKLVVKHYPEQPAI